MRSSFLSILLFLSLYLQAAPLKLEVHAEAAILVNADTGAILYEKNANRPLFPASITKVATALYALQQKGDSLQTQVVAQHEAIASIASATKKKNHYKQPSYWLETGATHIGIKKGESLSFKDLLYAVLVASANDASNMIAQHIGEGSIDTFMTGLNHFVRNLGCRDTQFLNPHGLHHPDHKTTARDMAIIACSALRNPLLREIVATKSYVIEKTNKQPARTLVQTNQLLKKGKFTYDKAIGVKTGYTSDAGYTLIAAAKHEGRVLVAVVLNCSERKEVYEDVTSLFETAFAEHKVKKRVLNKGAQQYKLAINGASSPLQAELLQDLDYEYFPAEEIPIQAELHWKSDLAVPLKARCEIGTMTLISPDGYIFQEAPLVAFKDVNPSLWYRVKQHYRAFAETSFFTKTSDFAGLAFVTFGSFWWLKSRKKAG